MSIPAVRKAYAHAVYMTARNNDFSKDECKALAAFAKQEAEDPEVALRWLWDAHRPGSEAKRLRAERDALLRCLADALGSSESEAWLVARLDMEGAE